MAKGSKTGGRDFKKGEVNNPKGRPRLPAHVKEARKLNKVKFEEILQKYVTHNLKGLKDALNDPDTPAIELAVVKILHESIKTGDQRRLEFILDRLIGKVKEEVKFEGQVHSVLDLVKMYVSDDEGKIESD